MGCAFPRGHSRSSATRSHTENLLAVRAHVNVFRVERFDSLPVNFPHLLFAVRAFRIVIDFFRGHFHLSVPGLVKLSV